MLKNILIASDASASSNIAVELAADLASKYDATLHILHVVRQMQLPDELRDMAEVEKIADQEEDVLRFVGEKILRAAKERARDHGAVRIRTAFGKGDPANAILDHARDNNADLIVMGTRGLGKVKGMLMGSVSRKVSNLSEVHCLIVR